MEMRAVEDVAIAEDLTPPLPPLAFSLHRRFLSSHCSACSLPLPYPHFSPTSSTNSCHAIFYCSPQCSSLDSPLHFSSNEHRLLCQSPSSTCPPEDESSSHLRLPLRLLHNLFQNQNAAVKIERIGGLMTNYSKLVISKENEDDVVLGMVKEGAKLMMLLAGKMGDGDGAVEEAVMCLVLTNAVEVQDENGRNVGIGVYDWRFSWINHSCSPNACYRFTTKTPEMDKISRLRTYPAAMDGGAGLVGDCKSSEGYGPRIIVRSIKGFKKDEEVTIAYTDLLQPKAMRQSELFLKYQFNCCCKRCSATPATYVDLVLQEISVCSPGGVDFTSDDNFYRCKATKKLMDSIDSAIDEYLTFNDPESCCEKLEELLTHGYLDEQQNRKPGKSQLCIKLHQLHHLSLNSYTTLASAYRVRASDLLAFNPENPKHQVEAFNMSRISAAYSLLLAVVTHHLFLSESSLIISVANFWKNAGESLLYFTRSSIWNTSQELQPSVSENSSIVGHKCYQIVQLDRFEANSFTSTHDQNGMFLEISWQFLNCIVNITAKVWSFLAHEGRHLKEIEDLIDFRWLLTKKSSLDCETHLTCKATTVSRVEATEHTNQERINLFQLGVHCLIYGGYLSSLCFGQHSQSTSEVVKLLRSEGILPG